MSLDWQLDCSSQNIFNKGFATASKHISFTLTFTQNKFTLAFSCRIVELFKKIIDLVHCTHFIKRVTETSSKNN
jgi:hypothetical protein